MTKLWLCATAVWDAEDGFNVVISVVLNAVIFAGSESQSTIWYSQTQVSLSIFVNFVLDIWYTFPINAFSKHAENNKFVYGIVVVFQQVALM